MYKRGKYLLEKLTGNRQTNGKLGGFFFLRKIERERETEYSEVKQSILK